MANYPLRGDLSYLQQRTSSHRSGSNSIGPPHDNIPNPGIFVAAADTRRRRTFDRSARHTAHARSPAGRYTHRFRLRAPSPRRSRRVGYPSRNSSCCYRLRLAGRDRRHHPACRDRRPGLSGLSGSLGATMTRSTRKAIVEVSTAAETSAPGR